MDPFRGLVSPLSSQSHDAPALSEPTSNVPTTSHSRDNPSSSVLFREIHKNAWLRRLPNLEKRSGVSNKKNEKVWTVFCVHDDIHPFLEFYISQEAAMEHKPNWFVCLNTTLHVSPTIIAHDQECEFVVTLPSDVVRLAAPTWDSMMEWVDVIRSKLREMKILSPQENVYSRMPEARLPLLPTRDPNSPLPPPPTGPSALVPGVEPVHMEPADSIPNVPVSPGAVAVSTSSVTTPSTSETRPSGSTSVRDSSSSSRDVQQPVSTSVVTQEPASPTLAASNARNTVSSTYLFANPLPPRTPPGVTSSQSTSPSVESATSASSRNVTVIEVSVAAPTQQTPCDIFNFNFIRESLPARTDADANPPCQPGAHARGASPADGQPPAGHFAPAARQLAPAAHELAAPSVAAADASGVQRHEPAGPGAGGPGRDQHHHRRRPPRREHLRAGVPERQLVGGPAARGDAPPAGDAAVVVAPCRADPAHRAAAAPTQDVVRVRGREPAASAAPGRRRGAEAQARAASL